MSIAYRRKQLGLSQADVARKLGVNQSAVHLWETGKAKPSAKRLVPLALLLKCTVEDILNNDISQKTEM